MNLLVFMMVVILPNGDVSIDARPVKSCPDKAEVNRVMDAQIHSGDILSWQAACDMIVLPLTAS
jgi:hypothetical protein